MRLSSSKCLAVCVLILFGASCRTASDDTVASDTPVTVQAAPAATTAQVRKDDCPATGKWALCSVEKRLRRSGFVATRVESESPERAGFSVRPAVYTLGRGRIEVFIYDDAGAMEKDIAAIDTLTVSPPGTAPAWPSPPGLIRNGNLAAVYMEQSSRQAERLQMALTAGAPSGG